MLAGKRRLEDKANPGRQAKRVMKTKHTGREAGKSMYEERQEIAARQAIAGRWADMQARKSRQLGKTR
jgi:hypothetical protein